MTRRDPDFDEFCDPDKPRQIELDDVLGTYDRLKPYLVYTPCKPSHFQTKFKMNLFYKLETQQRTGSVKDRGVLNCLLLIPPERRARGVVMGSLGNGGIALSFFGKKLGIPVEVILPHSACVSTRQRCHGLGAKVIIHGSNLKDAQKYARSLARGRGATYINNRDHPNVLSGYGTVAMDILQQVPLAHAVLVPVGCGGLAAAVSWVIKHIKPKCLVYGIQTESMPAFFHSLQKGAPSVLPMQTTMANEIAVPHVGVNAFANGQAFLDKLLLVKEDWIARAVLHLMESERLVVEGAGACGLAAIMGQLVPELRNKNVVCLLSGGNVDPLVLTRILERGLAANGQLMQFTVVIRDSSFAQAQLLRLLYKYEYNILRQFQDHKWTSDDIRRMEMRLVCRTKDLNHALELKTLLNRTYPGAHSFDNEPFDDHRTCACYVRKRLMPIELPTPLKQPPFNP